MEAAARQDRRLLSVGGGLSTQVLLSSLCEDPDLQKIIYRAASLFLSKQKCGALEHCRLGQH